MSEEPGLAPSGWAGLGAVPADCEAAGANPEPNSRAAHTATMVARPDAERIIYPGSFLFDDAVHGAPRETNQRLKFS